MAKPVHVIVAGDYNVGKTCLLISYTLKEFPTEYIPSTFESCYPVDNILVDGTEVLLRIYDQEHAVLFESYKLELSTRNFVFEIIVLSPFHRSERESYRSSNRANMIFVYSRQSGDSLKR